MQMNRQADNESAKTLRLRTEDNIFCCSVIHSRRM